MRQVKTPKEIMQQLVFGRVVGMSLNNKNGTKFYVLHEEPSRSLCEDLQLSQLLRFRNDGLLEIKSPLNKTTARKPAWDLVEGVDLDFWFL